MGLAAAEDRVVQAHLEEDRGESEGQVSVAGQERCAVVARAAGDGPHVGAVVGAPVPRSSRPALRRARVAGTHALRQAERRGDPGRRSARRLELFVGAAVQAPARRGSDVVNRSDGRPDVFDEAGLAQIAVGRTVEVARDLRGHGVAHEIVGREGRVVHRDGGESGDAPTIDVAQNGGRVGDPEQRPDELELRRRGDGARFREVDPGVDAGGVGIDDRRRLRVHAIGNPVRDPGQAGAPRVHIGFEDQVADQLGECPQAEPAAQLELEEAGPGHLEAGGEVEVVLGGGVDVRNVALGAEHVHVALQPGHGPPPGFGDRQHGFHGVDRLGNIDLFSGGVGVGLADIPGAIGERIDGAGVRIGVLAGTAGEDARGECGGE